MQEIVDEFNSYYLKLEDIIRNPDKYKDKLKVAKEIIKLKRKGKNIKKRKIRNKLLREIEEKKASKIREYLRERPKKRAEEYASQIGYEGEINEDVLFAMRLHKRLSKDEWYEKEAKLLEDLLKGKNPLEYEENKRWIEEIRNKVDIEKWLEGYRKEYIPEQAKDFYARIENERRREIEEAKRHLAELGIKVNSVEEIERVLKESKEILPENIYRDVKTHLQRYKSLKGIEESYIPEKIIIETEKNPLKALQMGEVVGSCLGIGGGNEYSAVTNVADVNKQVIYAKDERGNIIGRVLIGLNDSGNIVGYRLYTLDHRIDLEKYVRDFIHEYARKIGAKVSNELSPRPLTGEWYDDGIYEWK